MSTPTLTEFDPRVIPWQYEATNFFNNFNYNNGVLEMLFSGSVGSAKSIEAAHLIVIHCLKNSGARILVLRRALKDLKRTLWSTIIGHLADSPELIKEYNKAELRITLINDSQIIGDSYDKGDLEKFRSLELSGVAIEEASESNKDLYDAVKMRVGRLPKVKENFILTLTNPDEPSHYLFETMIEKDGIGNRKVFYSLTEQNPFLPKWYIENLKNDLDPMMAKRMLQGLWISIRTQTPYYAYDTNNQFLKDQAYEIDENLPLDLMHDFNIGQGKPMSAAIGQFKNSCFHIAKDFIVEGFDSEQIINEIISSEVFEKVKSVRVFGDFNGLNKDTRSKMNDYDIILKALQKYRKKNETTLKVTLHVPRSGNPPIKSRQNVVNAYCLNDNKKIRLFVYKEAKTVDKGLRLTKIRKGSNYQEDDSDYFQHVVTALGYYIYEYHTRTGKEIKPITIGSYR